MKLQAQYLCQKQNTNTYNCFVECIMQKDLCVFSQDEALSNVIISEIKPLKQSKLEDQDFPTNLRGGWKLQILAH